VNRPPAFFEVIDVDMSRCRSLLQAAKANGIRITYAGLLVRAAALALARNPDLHLLVCGRRVYSPSQVDIALSVAGDSSVSPVLVVESADRKPLATIAEELVARIPEVSAEHERMLQVLRRWGWIVPFAVCRRGLLRLLYRKLSFRRKGSGTFQVSLLKDVNYALTPMFGTCGILTAGRVRDSVIAVDGQPSVRPIMTMGCGADHRVWDGRAAERILLAVRTILENGELDRELELRLEEVASRS
jgi:pyruvate/2-oxoglutarate dehydrogenase complex dihydrolipoamide acyltransferase (E2) component